MVSATAGKKTLIYQSPTSPAGVSVGGLYLALCTCKKEQQLKNKHHFILHSTHTHTNYDEI